MSRVGSKLRKVVEVRPGSDLLECGHVKEYPDKRPNYYGPSVEAGLIRIVCDRCLFRRPHSDVAR